MSNSESNIGPQPRIVCKQSIDFNCNRISLSDGLVLKVQNQVKSSAKSRNTKKTNRYQKLGWFGTRHYVTIMLFFGVANSYTMKFTMSTALVAMVNQSAFPRDTSRDIFINECGNRSYWTPTPTPYTQENLDDGPFLWSRETQTRLVVTFFLGYSIPQIPFSILAQRYGWAKFLGWGMLFSSLLGFIVPYVANHSGLPGLFTVRFLQGIGACPIFPSCFGLLSKWIPPSERCRCAAFTDSGIQFGILISISLSGLLMQNFGGWPTLFYFFSSLSLVWSIMFLSTVREDPDHKSAMNSREREFIKQSIWGDEKMSMPPIPFKAILKSWPFYAILIGHMGQKFGLASLVMGLPIFMTEILHLNSKENNIFTSIPLLAMWLSILFAGWASDHYDENGSSRTLIRKIAMILGNFGPGICLIMASFTGCLANLTIVIISIGVGMNGIAYSGFSVNHIDLSPKFAGILMSFTHCIATLIGLLAACEAGLIVKNSPTQQGWRIVFLLISGVYFAAAIFYVIFASAEIQPWDKEEQKNEKTEEPGTNLDLNI